MNSITFRPADSDHRSGKPPVFANLHCDVAAPRWSDSRLVMTAPFCALPCTVTHVSVGHLMATDPFPASAAREAHCSRPLAARRRHSSIPRPIANPRKDARSWLWEQMRIWRLYVELYGSAGWRKPLSAIFGKGFRAGQEERVVELRFFSEWEEVLPQFNRNSVGESRLRRQALAERAQEVDFQQHLARLRKLCGADHIEPRLARNGNGREQTGAHPAVPDPIHRAFGNGFRGAERYRAGLAEVLRRVSRAASSTSQPSASSQRSSRASCTVASEVNSRRRLSICGKPSSRL